MTHIIATTGDKDALCGLRLGDQDAYVLQRHAPCHQYQQARCVDCYRLAELEAMLPVAFTQLSMLDGAA